MKITIIEKKGMKTTEAMKEILPKKLEKLEKYPFIKEDTTCKVLIKTYSNSQKVEITINSNVGILRAEVEDTDAYIAMDKAVQKIEGQIRKQKTRLEKRHKVPLKKIFKDNDIEINAIESVKETEVKTKTIVPVKMDLDEAILKMELLGHDFFVYLDDETNQTAIVYRRKNGGYGLIETEAA